MSSDKRKTGVAKAQPAVAKTRATLKQRTLFDSFFVKSSSTASTIEANTNDISPIEVAETPTAVISLMDTTTGPSQSTETLVPLLDVARGPEIASPVQILDLTKTPEPSDLDLDEHATQTEVLEKRRSPSIVIIDDDMISEISKTISSQSQKPEAKISGLSREQPIVIPSSPIKGPSMTFKPNAAVHPFFMSKTKPVASSMQPSTLKSKTVSTSHSPPYPSKESQHVKGPQMAFQGLEPPFPKRHSRQPEQMTSENTGYMFLNRPDIVVDEPSNTWFHSKTDNPNEPSTLDIPPEHAFNHPAIARLLNDGPDSLPTSSRPWTDKWRPSCAREVLGNENSAAYLRNWLRALELQLEGNNDSAEPGHPASKGVKGKSKATNKGTKRPRVVRTVDKQRKKSRLDSDEEDDNWIAYSDESEEEMDYEEIDEFGEILLPEVPASSQTSPMPASSIEYKEQDLGQLHNTILLSGPSGSGKTACVYACAEELGWDVFEVYPGVGRRNGANVDNLVGEVGKNHLVIQNRRNGEVLRNFISQKKQTGTDDASSHESLVASYSPRKKSSSKDILDIEESNNDSRPIRQSLILLEEVDILYKEDINFWATVTRIIKECKRPVICTCNDISLVPVEELPLQRTIPFEPCPADIASSYLQAVCSAEGYSVKRDLISRLYTYPLQGQESAGVFSPTYPPATLDLRRTLNTLQIKCTTKADSRPGIRPPSNSLVAEGTPEAGVPEAHPSAKPIMQHKKSEFLSFLDGELIRNASEIATTMELASYLPSGDDEVGHTILYDQYAADRQQFGQHDRHEDMMCSAVEISSRLFDVDVKEDDRTRKAIEESSKRSRHEQLTMLKEVCPPAVWMRGVGSLSFEYLPYVRQMVASEDAEEARSLENQPRTGRNTRNSARSGYVRMIILSPEGRTGAGITGLNIVEGA